MACARGPAHCVALLEQKYVVLEDITGMLPPPIKRIISLCFCRLPVCRNLLHCHCLSPYSLQCKCSTLIVKLVCEASLPVTRIVKNYSTCCSRFDVTQCASTLYVETPRVSARQVYSVLQECNTEPEILPISSGACIVLKNTCRPSVVVTLLIRMVNLASPSRFGYHVGDPGEREGELEYGRYCLLRFVDSAGLIQERLVKSLHFEDARAEEPTYPPPRLERGRWRCFYWPEACECEERCSCSNFQSITLSPSSVRDYLLSNLTKPLALWRYVQVHF
ncbi:E4.3 protein [Psittacine adenovirus 3]|uniref:E4.3 protein n=1 Tax=Psittacine adenovirus 3 TaxID=1580497 RepID=A0A5C0PVL6_9ADEN|nr:E4.3 protein [Psittacine adenovirus 3]